MTIVIILLMFILLSLSYLKDHKVFNPSTLFIGLWLFIIVLCDMRLFGLFEIDFGIYMIVLAGCLSFLIGDYIGKFKFKLNSNIVEKECYQYSTVKSFNIILFIAFCILFVDSLDNINLYLQGVSLSDVRYGDPNPSVGFNLGILTTYFAYPVMCASCFILLEKSIKEKKKLIYFFLPSLILLATIISDGGRLVVFQVIITIVFSLFLYDRIKFNLKNFSKNAILILIGVGTFYFMTAERGDKALIGVVESIYIYICGSLVMLNSLCNNGLHFIPLTFGKTSFLGVFRPIYNLLPIIGLNLQSYFYDSEQYALLLQYTIIDVTDMGNKYNYFSTCFSYFLKDYSYIGLFVLSFIYGFICSKCYRRMMKYKDMRSYAIYIFLLCGIFTSMMDFQFSHLINCLVFFYIIMLTTRTSSFESQNVEKVSKQRLL